MQGHVALESGPAEPQRQARPPLLPRAPHQSPPGAGGPLPSADHRREHHDGCGAGQGDLRGAGLHPAAHQRQE
eukprot:6308765-Lingulodinium_polyedra.AAC.1